MPTVKVAAGAGLRHVRVYTLDTNGYPDGDQSGSLGYAGKRLQGVKSFQSNVPDVQVINHTGDDRVFAQDSLPPNTLETATLVAGKMNLDFDATITDTQVVEVGEAQMGGMFTDRAGFEKQVAIMAFRQSLAADEDDEATFGVRTYNTYIYPSARIVPKGSPMAEGGMDENEYNVTPTPVRQTPWGVTFVRATHGYTTTTRLRLVSDNPLVMERWTGNNSMTVFYTEFAPISVARTVVYVDGVEATVNSVDVNAKSLTLSAAPGTSAVVVALYESTDLT